MSFALSWFWLVFVVLVADAAKQPPNILLIIADDLGWGDVSFHGSHQLATPSIDLLASSGVILNNYYVSPICSPSRSALLTGLHPIRTGMQHQVLAASQPYGLGLNFTTMGDYFRDLGYQTHLVGKWHQGMFKHDYLPTRRGFDSFFGYLGGQCDYVNRIEIDKYWGYDLRENEEPANLSHYTDQYSTDLYTERVMKLLRENAPNAKNSSQEHKPWFIYMAHQSVHAPIEEPTRYDKSFSYIHNPKRRKFAGMAATLDESVGRVFSTLDATGQLDNTIILFTTDNGGAGGSFARNHSHYFIDHSIGSNWPLKGHKYTYWEGGVRGTAFLWARNLTSTSHVSQQLMHITDILPTLYAAAGGNVHKLGDIDGVNMWPVLQQANHSEPNYAGRYQLLHNIDRLDRHFALRYRNFKLTGGTWNFGLFDNHYMAPGQDHEHDPNGICYTCSPVYHVLSKYHLNTKPRTIKVDCRPDVNPDVMCNSTNPNVSCLFDVQRDPCELTNLADKHPDVVKKLTELYNDYNRQYVTPVNKASDPRSDPQKHGGFWGPWLD